MTAIQSSRINSASIFGRITCKAASSPALHFESKVPSPVLNCRGGLGPPTQLGEGLAARRSLRRRSRVMNLFETAPPTSRSGLCVAGLFSQATGDRLPPKRLARACASSGLAKQNTTKSLSSRRREYVNGKAPEVLPVGLSARAGKEIPPASSRCWRTAAPSVWSRLADASNPIGLHEMTPATDASVLEPRPCRLHDTASFAEIGRKKWHAAGAYTIT
jgi:hypothetical protein